MSLVTQLHAVSLSVEPRPDYLFPDKTTFSGFMLHVEQPLKDLVFPERVNLASISIALEHYQPTQTRHRKIILL